MKDSIYSKVLLGALFFYVFSSAYVRIYDYDEVPSMEFFSILINSTPFDAFPLKYLTGKANVDFQMSVVSSQEVAQMLETTILPRAHEGLFLPASDISSQNQDYLVIQFKNSSHGFCLTSILKCYFSCFPYSTPLFLRTIHTFGLYKSIILPYPKFLEKQPDQPCDIYLRWKYLS